MRTGIGITITNTRIKLPLYRIKPPLVLYADDFIGIPTNASDIRTPESNFPYMHVSYMRTISPGFLLMRPICRTPEVRFIRTPLEHHVTCPSQYHHIPYCFIPKHVTNERMSGNGIPGNRYAGIMQLYGNPHNCIGPPPAGGIPEYGRHTYIHMTPSKRKHRNRTSPIVL